MLDWATESEARLRGRRMAILTVQRLTILMALIFSFFFAKKIGMDTKAILCLIRNKNKG